MAKNDSQFTPFFLSTFYQREESSWLIHSDTASAILKPGKCKFQSFWHCCYCCIHFKWKNTRYRCSLEDFNINGSNQITLDRLGFWSMCKIKESHRFSLKLFGLYDFSVCLTSRPSLTLLQLFLWIYINSFSDTMNVWPHLH